MTYHLGSWMRNVELLQNGGTVVRNHNVITIDNHLVHASWTQTGSDGISNT